MDLEQLRNINWRTSLLPSEALIYKNGDLKIQLS